jgi:hypothetical protein
MFWEMRGLHSQYGFALSARLEGQILFKEKQKQ